MKTDENLKSIEILCIKKFIIIYCGLASIVVLILEQAYVKHFCTLLVMAF